MYESVKTSKSATLTYNNIRRYSLKPIELNHNSMVFTFELSRRTPNELLPKTIHFAYPKSNTLLTTNQQL